MKLCGECLVNPAVDQRPGKPKRGRCIFCIGALVRAARRKAKGADDADQAKTSLHRM